LVGLEDYYMTPANRTTDYERCICSNYHNLKLHGTSWYVLAKP